jgi:DNA-binding CsgD family transcriptional regulator
MAHQQAYSCANLTTDRRPAPALSDKPAPERVAHAFLIVDAGGNALYASRPASEVLLWPDCPGPWAETRLEIGKRLRALLKTSAAERGTWPTSVSFVFGRRHYVCRSTQLETSRTPMTWVLVLEREQADGELSVAKRRYHFTGRETEVVGLLVNGLTTKEIAQSMDISANTVKAFIRLVMSKMGVTTRSGIVGKTLSHRGA